MRDESSDDDEYQPDDLVQDPAENEPLHAGDHGPTSTRAGTLKAKLQRLSQLGESFHGMTKMNVEKLHAIQQNSGRILDYIDRDQSGFGSPQFVPQAYPAPPIHYHRDSTSSLEELGRLTGHRRGS